MWLKQAQDERDNQEELDEEKYDDFIVPFDEAVRDSPEITSKTFRQGEKIPEDADDLSVIILQ